LKSYKQKTAATRERVDKRHEIQNN